MKTVSADERQWETVCVDDVERDLLIVYLLWCEEIFIEQNTSSLLADVFNKWKTVSVNEKQWAPMKNSGRWLKTVSIDEKQWETVSVDKR